MLSGLVSYCSVLLNWIFGLFKIGFGVRKIVAFRFLRKLDRSRVNGLFGGVFGVCLISAEFVRVKTSFGGRGFTSDFTWNVTPEFGSSELATFFKILF